MNKLYKDPEDYGLNKTSIFRIGGLLLAIFGFAAVIVWLMFTFTTSNTNTSSHKASDYSEQQPEPLTVLDWKWGYEKSIDGRVKNNSSKQYSYVAVEFNLYDEGGNHLGTALANTNNLEPNTIWKFTATPLMTGTANVTKAKLKGVTGY